MTKEHEEMTIDADKLAEFTARVDREFKDFLETYDLLKALFTKIYQECINTEEFQALDKAEKEWQATETYKHYDAKDETVDRMSDCLNQGDFEICKNFEEKKTKFRESNSREEYYLKKSLLYGKFRLYHYAEIPSEWEISEYLP